MRAYQKAVAKSSTALSVLIPAKTFVRTGGVEGIRRGKNIHTAFFVIDGQNDHVVATSPAVDYFSHVVAPKKELDRVYSQPPELALS